MRIAQIAPIIERVPPKKYGGTERVIYTLTEELVKMGHDVTLFASGDSHTNAKLISIYPRGLREAKTENVYRGNEWSLLNFGLVYKNSRDFDVIHDHTNVVSLPVAQLSSTPVVMTLHGPVDQSNVALYTYFNKPFLVTISKAQAEYAPHLNYLDNIYHGLYMEHYPFEAKPGNFLLYVGRLSPQKGVHFAIEAAQYLDIPLVIAAKLDSAQPHDLSYFKEYIEPKLSDQIIWIGEVDEKERNRLMSQALCFLHPVTWREPFGLTLIESMACGTPVIGFNQGSISEVIENGKTGFVVNNLEGMIGAIKNIHTIDRGYCREYALKKFSPKAMAKKYVDVYKRAILLRSAARSRIQAGQQYIFAHEVKGGKVRG